MKSAPIVALYPVEKRPEMYCVHVKRSLKEIINMDSLSL